MDPSNKITAQLSEIIDWRGDLLRELYQLINHTDSELSEDFKWGVPVWNCKGLVYAISAFKSHVKINFFKGAYLLDPKNLFNPGLDSKEHRSINFAESDKLDKVATAELIQTAIAYNQR